MRGIFDRWFIQHANNEHLGWSGSSWVPMSPEGVPTGDVQVCNFETMKEAAGYCQQAGLIPTEIEDSFL
jgi:hypothetical protein